jgi:hypothetical protein
MHALREEQVEEANRKGACAWIAATPLSIQSVLQA